MKKILLFFGIVLLTNVVYSQPDKSFYFQGDQDFNEELPFPGELSGHTFGEWHFSHDQLVRYLQTISAKSERVSMWEYGRTHENRPLYLLAITSPENQNKLEEIRKTHKESLTKQSKTDREDQPLILWLGYSVHGNESSPGNASMLLAYYLAVGENQEVQNILDSAVVLIDPCLNPDGFTRAATWSNMHTHKTIVKDPADRQFREDWPGGRTNHYWFDLNRDWLPAQHPESQGRLKAFHNWKPHVLTDHHEMGSSSTFFFQPGVPERMNPLTPDDNFNLTKAISKYHAEALDEIGSLYFSEEGFDDFYYGKGSTYPDVNASIGILFEQSRVMGQVIDSPHGELSFAEAIRNHFTVSLSTIRASMAQRDQLFSYQDNFYKEAKEKGGADPISGFVFGDQNDPVKLHYFLQLLLRHDVELYSLNEDLDVNAMKYKKGSSFVVPTEQDQYRLVKSMFEKRTHFKDSIFYDVSAWTLPLAFDINYSPLKKNIKIEEYKGTKIEKTVMPIGKIRGGKSRIGYVASGANYNIYSVLYQLKERGLIAKVAGKPFTAEIDNINRRFIRGSIFIPSVNQTCQEDELFECLEELAADHGVDFYSLGTGLSVKGIDMGSWNFIPVEKPEILVVAGNGVSSRSAGEIWHLLDDRMRIPVSMVKPERFGRVNLFEYNTIIMPDGRYDFTDRTVEKLNLWIEEGGTIIAMEDANSFLKKQEWIAWNKKEKSDDRPDRTLPYESKGDIRRIESVSGVTLRAQVDTTHPLAYGLVDEVLPVFKNNNLFISKTDDAYSAPVLIKKEPLMSGYLSSKNLKNVENTAWCLVQRKGSGQIISFADNPNFRGYWYGTNKIFLNAIFYGRFVR